LIYAPVVITFCGFWSLVPDVSVYYGRKLGRDELRWFMHDKIGDLFFLHRSFDLWAGEMSKAPPEPGKGEADTTTSEEGLPHAGVGGVWGLVLVVCMYLCMILGYLVYIRRLLRELDMKRAVIQSLSSRLGAQRSATR
jgi:hypothetical protein